MMLYMFALLRAQDSWVQSRAHPNARVDQKRLRGAGRSSLCLPPRSVNHVDGGLLDAAPSYSKGNS